jgi:predicted O-linked N-acetylglucosamine transferase (SPINDLY family)
MATAAEVFALAFDTFQAGRHAQAEQLFRQVLQFDPSHADSWYLLAAACEAQGKLGDAEAHARRALALAPDHAYAHNLLAVVLGRLGHIDQAVASLREAVRCDPSDAEMQCNLGFLLLRQGNTQQAVTFLERARQLNPRSAAVQNNLGLARAAQGRTEEALDCYREAIRVLPNYAMAHNNLAVELLTQGRAGEALVSFREALRLEPDLADARTNMLGCLNYVPGIDPDVVFAEHCRWGKLYDSAASTPPANDAQPDRRLRIGYVSPDFRCHPVARYIEPVLAHHDPQQVQVYCYAEVAAPDAISSRLQQLVPCWRNSCGLTDAQLARQIRDDRIDILVDLAGHTLHNRLRVFAYKPAPIQVTWLGYLNTTGLSSIDYRLTDDVLDPPGLPVRDTETLWRLPGGMCCFAAPADAPPVTALPAARHGYLTFGSLHNSFKLNSRVIELWSRVLGALPLSRLVMFHHTLADSVREEIQRQFTSHGIAGSRLDLRQGSAHPGYLGVYDGIDVSLDVLPWSGGVTTCEALWMGVPMLTLAGERPVNRNSAALLTRVGLADWAVPSPDEFVAAAVRLPGRLERLAQIRAGLRETMSATLCDAPRFTRQLEEAFRSMWQRWCGSRA